MVVEVCSHRESTLQLILNLSFSVPGSERLPSPNTTSTSPQLWGARNGTLPPIEKSEFVDTRPRESAVSLKRISIVTTALLKIIKIETNN